MKSFISITIVVFLFVAYVALLNIWALGDATAAKFFAYINYPKLTYLQELVVMLWIIGSFTAAYQKFIVKRERIAVPVTATVFISAILILIPEITIRVSHQLDDYFEQHDIDGYFSRYYIDENHSWLEKYPPNDTIIETHDEFTDVKITNSLGYRDREWDHLPQGALRILSLGDSFTEGVGDDTSWVRQLEHIYNMHCNVVVTTLNGGISGSDIVSDYQKYMSDLRKFKPNVVYVAINHTDFDDIELKGCTERFQVINGDSVLQYRKGPWWEYIYAVNHTFRAIMTLAGYGRDLLPVSEAPQRRHEALQCIEQSIMRFYDQSLQDSFQLVVVLHPRAVNIRNNSFGYMDTLAAFLNQHPEIDQMNLMAYYRDSVGINANNVDDYFWPIDWHQKSYKIFAEGIFSTYGCPAVNDTTSVSPAW